MHKNKGDINMSSIGARNNPNPLPRPIMKRKDKGSMNDLIKLRDVFRETADIIDELIELEDKEYTPEAKKQYESVMGRFMIKMVELQSLQN